MADVDDAVATEADVAAMVATVIAASGAVAADLAAIVTVASAVVVADLAAIGANVASEAVAVAASVAEAAADGATMSRRPTSATSSTFPVWDHTRAPRAERISGPPAPRGETPCTVVVAATS